MNVKSITGIIVLSLLIILSQNSCTDDPLKVGIELLPESDLLDAVADTLAVECYTAKGIPQSAFYISQSTADNAPIGHVIDPILGDSWSDVMMELNYVESSIYKHDSTDVYVGCKLYLHINSDRIYGGQNGFQVNVYPLKKLMYYNYPTDYIMKSEDYYFENEPVSENTIHKYLVQDKGIEGIDSGNYFLVLPLDSVYGEKLMDASLYSDAVEFKNNFPGFYLKSQAITETGGLNSFYFYSSRLVMEYKRTLQDINSNDSVVTKYSTFSIDYYNCFYRNRSNLLPAGPLGPVINDTINQLETFYVQSLCGVRGYIKIPGLESLRTKVDSIGINLAELVLPLNADNMDTVNFYNPLRLNLLWVDSEGNTYRPSDDFIPSSSGNYNPFYLNGFFNTKNMEYRINLTEFVHRYISDDKILRNFYLMAAVASSAAPSSIENKVPGRVVLNSGLAVNPAYLRVIYTKTVK